MKYYIGTLAELKIIEKKICENSKIPNQKGTEIWATPFETGTTGEYALPVPINGWNGCDYNVMTSGILADEVEEKSIIFNEPEYL